MVRLEWVLIISSDILALLQRSALSCIIYVTVSDQLVCVPMFVHVRWHMLTHPVAPALLQGFPACTAYG